MGYGAQSALGPQEAAFLQTISLSIIAASSGPDNIPAVSRALGCRISPDNGKITLFFCAGDAHELLGHIAGNGTIAAVFSLPRTHQALQLKATDAVAERPLDSDFKLVDAYRQAFVDHVGQLGHPRPVVETMLACDHDDLVAVTFTPAAVFSQTPGPNAGHAIGAAK
ncbi:MAG TPA: hypothetical protein VLT16_10485 [Candidatus Limnocylindrales bacterium]|nr:hypothetical protein [Candidatus Limnocylindrales bacterium]